MSPHVWSNAKSIPDHFGCFPLGDPMRTELLDIVFDVPIRRIKPMPVDHAREL
jgi:hypothetical protein